MALLISELIVGCLERGVMDSAHNSQPVTAASQTVQASSCPRSCRTGAGVARCRHARMKIARPPSVVDTAAGHVNGRKPPATPA